MDAKTLNLSNLRAAIPKEAFEKSLVKSFSFMFFDYAMCAISFYAFWCLTHSPIWETLPTWAQLVFCFTHWAIAGFFMWCLFVVGHDCGHGTFSNNEILNDIVGHIIHGSILVPYYPWRLSHRRHHMFHNHVTKDYSHPWYTEERLKQSEEALGRLMDDNSWIRFFFPFVGWQLYLYGMPDGSHFIPFPSQRMWRESQAENSDEPVKCIISAVVVGLYVAAIYYWYNKNVYDACMNYVGPWVVFGWWLVVVTYLQHHNPETKVYGDSNWKFVDSAFETVDRTFGFGIDNLHHNITDGHVAHHLFFTKIPHYNLTLATKAIQKFLVENKLEKLYKYEYTPDFALRAHMYMVQFGFKSTLSSAPVEPSSEVPRKAQTSEIKKNL